MFGKKKTFCHESEGAARLPVCPGEVKVYKRGSGPRRVRWRFDRATPTTRVRVRTSSGAVVTGNNITAASRGVRARQDGKQIFSNGGRRAALRGLGKHAVDTRYDTQRGHGVRRTDSVTNRMLSRFSFAYGGRAGQRTLMARGANTRSQ